MGDHYNEYEYRRKLPDEDLVPVSDLLWVCLSKLNAALLCFQKHMLKYF